MLIKINEEEQVTIELEKAQKKYPKATHYCYAYIFMNKEKANDDKEPQNTAGTPMLEILKKNNLTNILAITIRYFGGIKLGASGLIRAYSNSVRKALEKTDIKKLEKGYLIELTFPYNQQKLLDNLLKEMNITSKEFLEEIKYMIEIPEKKLNLLKKHSYKIIKEINITEK